MALTGHLAGTGLSEKHGIFRAEEGNLNSKPSSGGGKRSSAAGPCSGCGGHGSTALGGHTRPRPSWHPARPEQLSLPPAALGDRSGQQSPDTVRVGYPRPPSGRAPLSPGGPGTGLTKKLPGWIWDWHHSRGRAQDTPHHLGAWGGFSRCVPPTDMAAGDTVPTSLTDSQWEQQRQRPLGRTRSRTPTKRRRGPEGYNGYGQGPTVSQWQKWAQRLPKSGLRFFLPHRGFLNPKEARWR